MICVAKFRFIKKKKKRSTGTRMCEISPKYASKCEEEIN